MDKLSGVAEINHSELPYKMPNIPLTWNNHIIAMDKFSRFNLIGIIKFQGIKSVAILAESKHKGMPPPG